jgi:hypothetical protein
MSVAKDVAPRSFPNGMLESWNDGILGSGKMERWVIDKILFEVKSKYDHRSVTSS